jgi:tetratricopeptide (TPR) repeat protein
MTNSRYEVVSLEPGQTSKVLLKDINDKDLPVRTPTVSLHMMVKNAAQVIDRTLLHVLPYLSQVRILLNDTTDATEKVISGVMGLWSKVAFDVQRVTFESHPQFYIIDSPETYEGVGKSLAGETFPGPFTHHPILCDWSSVRNLIWGSSAEYRLQLDADDLLLNPETLPLAARAMEYMGADLAASQYQVAGTSRRVYRERLARSTPIIRWEGKIHDTLTGGLRRMLFEDLLTTRDMRDNKGTDTRVVARDLKVLYYLARKAGWDIPLRHWAYLIQEARYIMPYEWVTDFLLEGYRYEFSIQGTPDRLSEKSWVYGMIGEVCEERGDFAKAVSWYEQAATACSTKAMHWKLSRAHYLNGNMEACLAEYDRGAALGDSNIVMDLAPVQPLALLCLVASAASNLGRHARALEVIDTLFKTEGVAQLPSVIALREEIVSRQLAK